MQTASRRLNGSQRGFRRPLGRPVARKRIMIATVDTKIQNTWIMAVQIEGGESPTKTQLADPIQHKERTCSEQIFQRSAHVIYDVDDKTNDADGFRSH